MRQEIAALETGYRIGRILVIREALGQAPAGFSAATKCFCTEHEQRVADFVAGVLGPAATLWDDVVKGLVYAPGYTIMGGTSNVMRNILGERVLGLPRSLSSGERATVRRSANVDCSELPGSWVCRTPVLTRRRSRPE